MDDALALRVKEDRISNRSESIALHQPEAVLCRRERDRVLRGNTPFRYESGWIG